MNNIAPISEWRRIFFDTSFIIDAVRDLNKVDKKDTKYLAIKNAHELIEFFKNLSHKKGVKTKWITSSIVLSELTKFENKDAIVMSFNIFLKAQKWKSLILPERKLNSL